MPNRSRKKPPRDTNELAAFVLRQVTEPEPDPLPSVTPAMEAGIAKHAWGVDEMIALLEAGEPDTVAVGAKRKDRQ